MTIEWPSWVDPMPFPFPELHNIPTGVYSALMGPTGPQFVLLLCLTGPYAFLEHWAQVGLKSLLIFLGQICKINEVMDLTLDGSSPPGTAWSACILKVYILLQK